MSYGSAAREAPKEHGIVAGVMTGTWLVNNQLADILRMLRDDRMGTVSPMPEVEPTVLAMATQALRHNTYTIALLAELRALVQTRL